MSAIVWIPDCGRLGLTPSEELEKTCNEKMPTALDKETLTAYAEQCGKEVALQYASDQLGVNVSGCSKASTKQIPECIANNYGITLDVYSNGKVNWDNVVRDAGAVGGIILCGMSGVAVVAASLCGKIGGEIAATLYEAGKGIGKIGETIIQSVWGGDEGGGYACGRIPSLTAPDEARDIARYFKNGVQTTVNFPVGAVSLGPPIAGTIVSSKGPLPSYAGKVYWTRMFQLRALATGTAIIAAEISRKTGAAPSTALRVLAPAAPTGWVELVRPIFNAVGDKPWPEGYPDYLMNIGGMFSIVTDPRLLLVYMQPPPSKSYWQERNVTPPAQPIIPRWQQPNFWSGVSQPSESALVWRYFSISKACPNSVVVWGDVANVAQTKKTISNKASPSDYDFWVYSTPSDIDQIVTQLNDQQFQAFVAVWKSSIETNLDKKIAQAKANASTQTSSALPLIAGAVTVGVIAWALA